MKLYDYNKNENVHYVELDFITGIFSPEGLKRQMWGGFAMILMLAEKNIQNSTLISSFDALSKWYYPHTRKQFLLNKWNSIELYKTHKLKENCQLSQKTHLNLIKKTN